jgi:hypothetical protein
MKGYLKKKHGKEWKLRFFVLENGTLLKFNVEVMNIIPMLSNQYNDCRQNIRAAAKN